MGNEEVVQAELERVEKYGTLFERRIFTKIKLQDVLKEDGQRQVGGGKRLVCLMSLPEQTAEFGHNEE